MPEESKLIEHLEKIILNLNQHWHSIHKILSYVSKPLLVDDRGLANTLREIRDVIYYFKEDLKNSDIEKVLGEIKYIGMRLNSIENSLRVIEKDGIKRQVQLDFKVDGYELVKKPINYDQTEPIEEPYSNIKKILDLLTPRQQYVLIHRFGLLGEKPKTLTEIGKLKNLSFTRIRHIQLQALRILRSKKVKIENIPENKSLLVALGNLQRNTRHLHK